ncbi:MAG: transferase [Candidatus Rokuibacteriota bacterium]|nr:MAG: transferase [Candidatus Rokubacteria bacterium]
MKILILHSRYRSGPVSGENRVVDDEVRLLRDAGHEVEAWQPGTEDGTSATRLAEDAIWSRSATHGVRRLVAMTEADIVHVHSLYPRLSPAVLRTVPRAIPVVMTLHNFRLMCLPATYLRGGAICEDCASRLPWRGVMHACYRDSRSASGALALSLAIHRLLGTFSRVDQFLAVSQFVREKHVEAGLPDSRVAVKPNFAWPTARRSGAGGPLLYVGRIAPEKGLDTIIRALPASLELVVAGDGPDRARLESQASSNVRFLGQVDTADVESLLRSARALVVPSRWYEGQPRAIVEAFAAGVPVLASRIGGLPELIEDGVDGYLVEPSEVPAWRAALYRFADDAEAQRLGDGAYRKWKASFTPPTALSGLEAAYTEAVETMRLRMGD